MKKTNIAKLALSLFGKLLIAIVMSLIVSISMMLLFSKIFNVGIVIAQICCLGIFLTIPYSMLWEAGSADKNKVNFGHEDEDLNKGFKVGLLASMPAFFSAALLLLFSVIGRGGVIKFIFYGFNAYFAPTLLKVIPLNMPMGDLWPLRAFLVSLLTMILPLVAWIAYRLGYKRISLIDKFVYKNAPRKRKVKKRR